MHVLVTGKSGEEEDTEDDEGDGDERDIWSVTHVTKEEFETTEGETEDLYDKLMEMTFVIKVVFFIKVGDPINYVFRLDSCMCFDLILVCVSCSQHLSQTYGPA